MWGDALDRVSYGWAQCRWGRRRRGGGGGDGGGCGCDGCGCDGGGGDGGGGGGEGGGGEGDGGEGGGGEGAADALALQIPLEHWFPQVGTETIHLLSPVIPVWFAAQSCSKGQFLSHLFSFLSHFVFSSVHNPFSFSLHSSICWSVSPSLFLHNFLPFCLQVIKSSLQSSQGSTQCDDAQLLDSVRLAKAESPTSLRRVFMLSSVKLCS